MTETITRQKKKKTLQDLPRKRFLEEQPVLLLSAFPDTTALATNRAWSSTSASTLISLVVQNGQIPRGKFSTDYIFTTRPEKGELLDWFKSHKKKKDAEELEWEASVDWCNFELGSEIESVLPWAYTQMLAFKQILQRTKPKIIVAADKWTVWLLTGLASHADLLASESGVSMRLRGAQLPLAKFWDLPDSICIPVMPMATVMYEKEMTELVRQDCRRIGNYYVFAEKSAEAWKTRITPEELFFIPKFGSDEEAGYIVKELKRLALLAKASPFDLSVDIETSSGHIDTIGLAWSDKDALGIPFYPKGFPNKPFWSEENEIRIIVALRELLTSAKVIGQNFFYDQEYIFWDMGIFCTAFDDTMGQSHVMFPLMQKDLGYLSSLYRVRHVYWKDQLKLTSVADRTLYCLRDCVATFEICMTQRRMMANRTQGLNSFYEFTQRELTPNIFRMSLRGFPVDRKVMSDTARELQSIIDQHTTWLDAALPESVNFASPTQVAKMFYDNLAVKPCSLKGKSLRSTDDQALVEIISQGGLAAPIAARISDLRSISKAKQDTQIIVDKDGRVRTAYNPYGTVSYRLNSKKTHRGPGRNMQNVTAGGSLSEMGFKLPNSRKMFVPPKPELCDGKIRKVFDIDLDSADARVVAARSGAKKLQEWFDQGKKPYVEVMKIYMKDDTLTKASEHYRTFKSLLHGTHYYGKAAGMAGKLGLSVREVQDIQDWYLYDLCPEIGVWQRNVIKNVDAGKPIITVFGAELFVPQNDATKYEKAMALEPQSTVATLIKKGICNIMAAEPYDVITPILDVHDSIAGFFLEEDPTAPDRIRDYCTIPLDFGWTTITIPVDIVHSSESWGHCK